jgi:hypothetical protein
MNGLNLIEGSLLFLSFVVFFGLPSQDLFLPGYRIDVPHHVPDLWPLAQDQPWIG